MGVSFEGPACREKKKSLVQIIGTPRRKQMRLGAVRSVPLRLGGPGGDMHQRAPGPQKLSASLIGNCASLALTMASLRRFPHQSLLEGGKKE